MAVDTLIRLQLASRLKGGGGGGAASKEPLRQGEPGDEK